MSDAPRQRLQDRRVDFVPFEAMFEVHLGRHPHHLHRPFHDRPRRFELKTGSLRGNGHDSKIHVWSESPIDANFLFAKMMATFESRKIEKAEVDRFLDLVRHLSSEKDRGDVRLVHFDLRNAARKSLRF